MFYTLEDKVLPGGRNRASSEQPPPYTAVENVNTEAWKQLPTPSVSRSSSDRSDDSSKPLVKPEQGRDNPHLEVGGLKQNVQGRVTKGKSEDSQHVRDRVSWICAVISITICVISVILMGLTVSEYCNRSQITPQPEALEYRVVCLPCMKFILDPFDPNGPDFLMDKLTKRWEEDELKCCAETPEQLSVMREAFTRPRKTRPELDLPQTGLPSIIRVSAHKALLEPDRNLDPAKDHILTRMNPHSHDPMREHVRGVKVDDTRMTIQHTGYYYVYISALYKANSSHIGNEPPGQFWLVSVHQVSPDDPARGEFLLTVTHTPSPTDMENQAKHTGYSGGVFLLKKGESLTVCLEAHDTVEFKKESTYLGLFWVRGQD